MRDWNRSVRMYVENIRLSYIKGVTMMKNKSHKYTDQTAIIHAYVQELYYSVNHHQF